ncbi:MULTISPECIES: HAD-IIA family hydrolase [Paenibacillus]|uniref:HAD-IIA family hydrolase n=1 Tax=Paenibacillus TaxID=44249 RepID=UPI00038FBFCB|nr:MULTISPECIES: HAD-IIA family hydrolase [Paenibacillus]
MTKTYSLPGMPAPDRPIGGLLLDLDGTIYRGEQAVDGAGSLVRALRDGGVPYKYVTNNSSSSPEAVAKRLREMGVDAEADEVCTSSQAAARYAAERFPGGRVFLIGEEGLAAELEQAGLMLVDRDADLVVQGIDRAFSYAKASEAVRELLAGAEFILTNPDLLLPSHGGLFPGAGSIGAMLAAASGVKPVVIGKPEKILMDYSLERLGLTAGEAFVVGDNLATDIAAGKNSGCGTILVLTGLTTPDNYARYAEAADAEPDAACGSLADLQSYILKYIGR